MAPFTEAAASHRDTAVVRLEAIGKPKPWGRRDLGRWAPNIAASSQPVGEIHHLLPGSAIAGSDALLVKTLFTAQDLSVQVHPRAANGSPGKDEAWVVLAAEPGSRIGLGLKAPCDPAVLASAALDGSIVDLLEWHDCAPGDVFFAPAGTIHAIGAGVTLFEVQQNHDVTYRLFDYGRGRPLHLEAGLAVAHPGPCHSSATRLLPCGRAVLVEGPSFVLEREILSGSARLEPAPARPLWVAIVGGSVTLDDVALAAGDVALVSAAAAMAGDAEMLVAYPGADAAPIWREI